MTIYVRRLTFGQPLSCRFVVKPITRPHPCDDEPLTHRVTNECAICERNLPPVHRTMAGVIPAYLGTDSALQSPSLSTEKECRVHIFSRVACPHVQARALGAWRMGRRGFSVFATRPSTHAYAPALLVTKHTYWSASATSLHGCNFSGTLFTYIPPDASRVVANLYWPFRAATNVGQRVPSMTIAGPPPTFLVRKLSTPRSLGSKSFVGAGSAASPQRLSKSKLLSSNGLSFAIPEGSPTNPMGRPA